MSMTSQATVDAPTAGAEPQGAAPDDKGAYLAALLARVETLDGGQALAVILQSVLDRLDRIEQLDVAIVEFCDEAEKALSKFATMKLPFGLGKLG